MKKLLVLLALCMVISVALVACNKNTDDPVDSSDAETTEAPTETESESETESTTETETETESTTETESESESETEPTPDPVKVVAGKSWDSLTAVPGEAIFASGVDYLTWENNAVAEINMATNTLDVWGWIAYFTETEGTVGYKINDGEVVYDASFTYTAESGVQEHITANVPGALSACRMKFSIPVATLAAGEHTVALIAKDPAGNEEVIKEFKVIKTVPYVEPSAEIFNRWSFDGFYLNDTLYFEKDGEAASKLEAQNKIVPINYGADCYNIGFRGWVSFKQETAAFGYFIAGYNSEIIFDEFKQDRPDLAAAGIENGVGFNIYVPTGDLGLGDYNVSIYAKLADETIVKLYDITLSKLNLTINTDIKFMVSIDHVNGMGPFNAETGEWAANYQGIGGTSTGKIDAAVDFKTNDKNGLLTFGGWCGVPGGVNRYVWSIDGVNWMEVVSGGTDGEPLDGYFNGLNTEEGMTSTKNGMFNGENCITIDLSIFPAGAQGNIMVGAIPENNPNAVIVICELANVTVAPVVETIYFDGENGTFTVAANFETKFVARNVAGQIIKIENAFNFVVTATNVYTGQSVVLQPNMLGTIEEEIPEDWSMIELTVANITEEAVEVTVAFEEPSVAGLVLGENVVTITVSNFYAYGAELEFTAEEAGTYAFSVTDDADQGELYYWEAPHYGWVEELPFVIELEAGQTIIVSVSTGNLFMESNGEGTVDVDVFVARI